MDDIIQQVENLDNVQLRTELLKHGEKVGPVTPTTRKLFVNRLAKKLYAMEHQSCDAGSMTGTGDKTDSTKSAPPPSTEQAARADEPSQGVSLEEFVDVNAEKTKSYGNRETQPLMYYLVTLADSAPDNKGHRLFTEKAEALVYMKKNTGARLKLFPNLSEVQKHCTQNDYQGVNSASSASRSKTSEDLSHSLPQDGEKSAFKGPKIQELVQFRKSIEKGDLDALKGTIWSNPRYLISSADTPVILHEGMRHNALHIAAKTNQPDVVSLVLEAVQDPEFTKLLYSSSRDTDQSRHRRINYLVDLYLNSPDKGSGESPLHIACKMGFPAVVQALIMYSTTDKSMLNKYGETPEDIICSRSKGDAQDSKEQIKELLKGLCLVPLLRSEDNITVPVVGTPCSPDERMRLCEPVHSATHSPKDPILTLSAYAGPMSPSKAKEFHRQWSKPHSLRKTLNVGDFTALRADPEKGHEQIGRKLARELHVPWTEYWQFLDAFADFSTAEGLQKLEHHLQQQQALRSIMAAMSGGSPSVSDQEEGADDSSDEDSSQENYYSCDEGSHDGAQFAADSSPVSDTSTQAVSSGQVSGSLNGQQDVFEDSLEEFHDLSGGATHNYLFGQRLLLTRTSNSSSIEQKTKETKGQETTGDVLEVDQTKSVSEAKCPWTYRDTRLSGEEECRRCEASENSDTTKSFDASSSTDVDAGITEHDGDKYVEQGQASNSSADDRPQTRAASDLDKSFNTVMSELSEDLESKLVFSPDGKVVRSMVGCCAPDVGVCLGQKVLGKGQLDVKKGRPSMEVMIKSSADGNSFMADVLVHFVSVPYGADEDSDESVDSLDTPVNRNVYLDVKIVTRNGAVHRCIKHMEHPTLLTVGLLEEDAVDLTARNVRCVMARLARAKSGRKCAQLPSFIYGSRPSKTDLDVKRAMCGCQVDSSRFPLIQSWLSLVTATQKEGVASWPSPSRLRHQHRLSQLQHQTTAGSSLPISPLVQGGAVTSTPVSRGSLSSIRCNRDLSPERLTQTMPRAWLFKSPQ